jgi:transmembrane sensor
MDKRICDQAVEWVMKANERPLTPTEKEGLEHWLASSTEHQRAWSQVQLLVGKLERLPSPVRQKAYRAKPNSRRRFLSVVALLGAGAAVGIHYQRSQYVTTAGGDQKTLELERGLTLVLNAQTRISLRFEHKTHRVYLHHGDVFIQSEPSVIHNPIRVETESLTAEPMGTVFSVSSNTPSMSHQSSVKVVEGRVRLSAKQADTVELAAGDSGHVSHITHQIEVHTGQVEAVDWVQRHWVVDGWPMKRVLEELSRYQSHWIEYSSEIETLRVYGVFDFYQTQEVLSQLEQAFPIRVYRMGRYFSYVKRG